MKELNSRDLFPFLGGLLVGIILSLFAAFFLVLGNIQHPKVRLAPTFTSESKSVSVSTATITPIPISISTISDPYPNMDIPTPIITNPEDYLKNAQNYLDEGYPERAKELLLPVIDNWPGASDKAAGYKFLGDGEVWKGHFQLAAPYYEKMYFFDPTPENLYILAMTYDIGGNFCKALTHYKELDAWSDPNAQIDRESIKSRIKEIEDDTGDRCS